MIEARFKIVFEKLSEATSALANDARSTADREATVSELDEIAALRKIVLETVVPEPKSYTTT